MQSLWLLKINWDDTLPSDIAKRWHAWLDDLLSINHIKIPRWTGLLPEVDLFQIHGFAETSKFRLHSNSANGGITRCSCPPLSSLRRSRVKFAEPISIPFTKTRGKGPSQTLKVVYRADEGGRDVTETSDSRSLQELRERPTPIKARLFRATKFFGGSETLFPHSFRQSSARQQRGNSFRSLLRNVRLNKLQSLKIKRSYFNNPRTHPTSKHLQ